MTTTINERIERLQSYHQEFRIIRFTWHDGEKTSDGYERACLLAAFSPEAGEAKEASACPADAMPRWLATLTPSLDDNVSDEAWPSVVARYVAVLPSLVRLPAERLICLDFATRAVAVREARRHTRAPKVLAAIDGVLVLLDRASVGREVSKDEWSAARETAAQWSAYWAAAAAEAASAGTAKSAAAWAAWAAAEAAWAAAAAEAALRASWDRMADAMLSAWFMASQEAPEVGTSQG